MVIKFKWADIEANYDEVLDLLILAAGGQEGMVYEEMREIWKKVQEDSKVTAAADPEPKKAKEKPKKKERRKELDVPKMKALREAGWSMAKIADEMRCSPQTVSNKLKEA